MIKMLMATTIAPTIEAFLIPFAQHFRNRGWHIDAFASGATQSTLCKANFDQQFEAEWKRTPAHLDNWKAVKTLQRLVAREQYDLVHVHTPVAAFLTRYALRRRKPGQPTVVYTAHGFHFYKGASFLKYHAFHWAEKLAAPWTDHLVVINREDEEAASRFMPRDKLTYMPGIGVDMRKYNLDAVADTDIQRVRTELGFGSKDRVFLILAELIGRKRHADIFQALARIGRPNVHLLLGGTGAAQKQLQEQAKQLGINKQVHFLGYRRDVSILIRLSEGLILSSAQEGLPRSVMEALALERPVIGSRIRGTTELLEPGCGVLVEVGHVDGYASAMVRLLDDPEAARAMGVLGRQYMRNFDITNIIRLHEELYAKVLGATWELSPSAAVPVETSGVA